MLEQTIKFAKAIVDHCIVSPPENYQDYCVFCYNSAGPPTWVIEHHPKCIILEAQIFLDIVCPKKS